MNTSSKKVVVGIGARTPIGHISRSLAPLRAQDLLESAVRSLMTRAKLPAEAVDGLVAGWVGQDFTAPNIARVVLLRAGLPRKAQAVTVQNNCVSSIESIAEAARCVLAGDGDLYIAGGTESMSRLPYSIDGPRSAKALRSLDTIKAKWAELWQNPEISIIDSIEQGLTDPVEKINMAGTAEVAAQMYGISRQEQDAYAVESFRRALAGWNAGFYAPHVAPPAGSDGKLLLEKDEYPFLRADLVEKPERMAKAPVLFDNKAYSLKDFYRDFGRHIEGRQYREGLSGTVTLFNSCARSDAAAAVIVASEAKAKELGIEVLGEIKSWSFYGNNPAHMGVAPALAAPEALKRAGLRFSDLDAVELHEPFAATVLAIFKVGKERFGCDWNALFQEGKLNPHGGSIALGHPLGATGARLMLNLLYSLRASPKARRGLIASCAGGGMGGAMVVEKAGA